MWLGHDPSFLAANDVTKFQGDLPQQGRHIHGVGGKFAIFVRNRHLSRKQYDIGPWLLRITNRKS